MIAKPKIILYNPKAVFYDMPLALMAIASNIDRKMYEVIIIDGRLFDNPIIEIKKHLKNTICFGVSVLTGSPLKDALEVTKKFKELAPKVTTVWGGWHPSLFPKQILEDTPFVDITVQRQGETTFNEILSQIQSTTPTFSLVKGITYRDKENNIKKILQDLLNQWIILIQ